MLYKLIPSLLLAYGLLPKTSAIVGDDECTWGPSHWCSDKAIAEKCGAGAVKFCQGKQLGVFANEEGHENPKGADECTWGPSHWCSSVEVAQKCQVYDHCVKIGALEPENDHL